MTTKAGARQITKVKVWGIYVPKPGVIPLATLRTKRRACIKEYTEFYTAQTRPKLTWTQIRQWGWRCIPVDVSFTEPKKS